MITAFHQPGFPGFSYRSATGQAPGSATDPFKMSPT